MDLPGQRRVLPDEGRKFGQPGHNPASPLWMQRMAHVMAPIPPPPGLEHPISSSSEDEGSVSSPEESSSEGHVDECVNEVNLDRLFAALSDRSCKTTLMIRNVPVLYTREMLLEEWPNQGTYDFLYLPFSCSTQRNLSYGFVNFTSEAAARAFVGKWQKKRLPRFTSRKPLNISFAEVQGLDSNLWELKKKRVKRIKVAQCQPLIFDKYGGRVDLMDALNEVIRRAATLQFFGGDGGVISL